ncbi:MAG: ribosome rescue GTPase HflX [Panacagrimonas sp.]
MQELFERPGQGDRAILIHLALPGGDYESEREEFEELCASAGADTLGLIGGSRNRPDPGLFVGSGKAEEIAAAVSEQCAELAIFNHNLSPSQERNLERILCCRVLDRAGLILDIFARRARSHEGKLQVELAQLRHLSTRLVRGWTHLERQRGGIGLRGPGESQLETDRRMIRERMATLKRHLEQVRKRRSQNRMARQRRQTPAISLVGYTNAGKSTLFNALTGEQGFASNQLFATLDTTVRRLDLPVGVPAVLADTVGFIRDLPHDLIAAFRATLEESREADLLLHVVDAADPERNTRIAQVEAVLEEIGAGDVPCLQVFNKIDLRETESARIERDEQGLPRRVYLSARQAQGLDLLRAAIAELQQTESEVYELCVPAASARLRAQLFQQRAIQSEQLQDDGSFRLQVLMPYQKLRGLCQAAGLEAPPQARMIEDWEAAT